MKQYLLSIMVLFIFTLPAFAQDDEAECVPDLTDSIAQLESLQSTFDEYGLEEVIINLRNIRQNCVPTSELVLDHFAVSYPAAWETDVSRSYLAAVGTSTKVAITFGDESVTIPSGEFVIYIFADMEDFFGPPPISRGDPLRNLEDMLLSADSSSEYTYGELTTSFINDRQLAWVSFTSEFNEGAIMILDLGDDHYSVFVPMTAIGEFQNFEPTLTSLLESARYMP